jgi:hypothetical protein
MCVEPPSNRHLRASTSGENAASPGASKLARFPVPFAPENSSGEAACAVYNNA